MLLHFSERTKTVTYFCIASSWLTLVCLRKSSSTFFPLVIHIVTLIRFIFWFIQVIEKMFLLCHCEWYWISQCIAEFTSYQLFSRISTLLGGLLHCLTMPDLLNIIKSACRKVKYCEELTHFANFKDWVDVHKLVYGPSRFSGFTKFRSFRLTSRKGTPQLVPSQEWHSPRSVILSMFQLHFLKTSLYWSHFPFINFQIPGQTFLEIQKQPFLWLISPWISITLLANSLPFRIILLTAWSRCWRKPARHRNKVHWEFLILE